jgi:hypothetical protein
MKPAAFQVHKSWLISAVLVLLLTVLADGAVVWFVQRPLPWAVLIPATLPLTLFLFVGLPLLKQDKRDSQAGRDRR